MNLEAPVREGEARPTIDSAYPPSSHGWYCVSILALALMINFLDRGILPLLVQPIKADLGLSDLEMSWIMGFAFTFFYAIFGLPVARLVDRKSRKLILSAGFAIFAVMTVVTGFARSFWQLFIARVGMGVGETTSGPAAYSLISDYFPPHRLPRAISVMQIGFVTGTGMALLLGASIIDYVAHHPGLGIAALEGFKPWQLVLMAVSVPGFIISALLLTIREPARQAGAASEPTPVREVFGFVRRFPAVYWPLFIGMGLRSAQMFGTQNWGPAFFQRHYGWSPQQVGYYQGPVTIIAMLAGIAIGNWLAEYYWKRGRHDGNVRTVWLTTFISVPFGILFPFMPTPWLALAMLAIQQATSMMAAAPENAAIQSVTPNRLRGQMTFLFLFIMNVVGMGLGPLIVGAFTDFLFGEANVGYSIALMGLICGVPAIVAFRRGMAPYGKVIATGRPLE